ncbi:hypothetical protein [Thalassotalea agarivorans]|nr:hypothetical protein [Thalassotalea agarivorans]
MPKQSLNGYKVYGIVAEDKALSCDTFIEQWSHIEKRADTLGFVIFHQGAQSNYLVLCEWGNDNELFTRVFVQSAQGWIEDSNLYSFCVYDMTVMHAERELYIRYIYTDNPDTEAYLSSYYEGHNAHQR